MTTPPRDAAASRLGLALDRAKLAELVAQSEQRLAAVAGVQRDLAALRVEVRSRDRSLSVALGTGGVLANLTFHTEAYRSMAPAELSRLILDTVAKAREGYAARADEAMAPIRTGARLPIEQIMSGTFDAAAFLEGER